MMKTNYVYALVAAAGQGTRLGAAVPKAYVELDGQTLLARSVKTLAAAGVDEVVITVAAEMEAVARGVIDKLGLSVPVRYVHGFGERMDSVWQGLQVMERAGASVLVHDAARALTPLEMIQRVIAKVQAGSAAVVPVLPVADTIKVVADGVVQDTPPRAQLRAVQTPQGFDLGLLQDANRRYAAEKPAFVATDDASLMEWAGHRVDTVDGDTLAFKITTPLDLLLAQGVLHDYPSRGHRD